MLWIEARSAAGEVLARAEGEKEARLVYRGAYRQGDMLFFQAQGVHAHVCVDQAVRAAPVYLPKGAFTFPIPFGDAKNGYPPQAFLGEMHVATLRAVEDFERKTRRNVALNPFDFPASSDCFPHAVANVETRGEAQFFARNAIDGWRVSERHGGWPYHSWGIGGRTDAWIRVDFGRPVRVDEVCVTLRADFPHDAWWERATLCLSDGFSTGLSLVKTGQPQAFSIGEHITHWALLKDLIKADDPSPFPALTQLEVFGAEA